MSSESSEFETALSNYLAEVVEGFQSIESVRQLTSGASKQTFRIQVDTFEGIRLFALRAESTAASPALAEGQLSLGLEAKLMQAAAGYGVPTPKVYQLDFAFSESDGSQSMVGFLMDWLDGETLGHKIVYSPEYAQARQSLASRCGEVLADIHSIDLSRSGLDQELETIDTADLVDEMWQRYAALGSPYAMIDYTWRWLKDNIPNTARQTLVHGDFRNGNLMIDQAGIKAVLDWELSHIGDPIRDLGWLCVNSWRFGNADLEVGGFGSSDELIEAYERQSGLSVSPDDLRFWQVFGSFWWSITTLLMGNTWRTGENTSIERPVIGRRSSEAQMDCVNLLFPAKIRLDAPAESSTESAQLPLSSELLASVQQFLQSDMSEALEPRDRFMTKVAANSLSIVERELTLAPAFSAAEKSRLQTLLTIQGDISALRQALVSRLREGLDLHTPGLQDHLRNTVASQLSIDQPRYSGLTTSLAN